MKNRIYVGLWLALLVGCVSPGHHCVCDNVGGAPLVLMTDYSLKDGAVSELRGVAYQVSPHLVVSDLTHEIPPFNIWQGAYRLSQTYKYWPSGTVFVSVVDPGVGSERRSIVVRTKSGHIFVGPDNGLFTLVGDEAGIATIRVIDESKERLPGSGQSNTFHGRDIYAYVGARIAAGLVKVDEVGTAPTAAIVRLAYQRPEFTQGELRGLIPILDPNYGNVWTNIPKTLVEQSFPNHSTFLVRIFNGKNKVFENRLPLFDTFSAVEHGKPLLYYNSLMNLAVALNQDDFAKRFKIQSGPDWLIVITK